MSHAVSPPASGGRRVPKGDPVENALFRVEAEARRLGGQCADMYFQEINITGPWVEAQLAGGLRFQASGVTGESPKWMTFGKVQVKVAHGHTRQGVHYLNFYVKRLVMLGLPLVDCWEKTTIKT